MGNKLAFGAIALLAGALLLPSQDALARAAGFMAVVDFMGGSAVFAVDSIVLSAVFMADASAGGVVLGETLDIMDFMVIQFTDTTAALSAATDAIIKTAKREMSQ